VICVRHGWQEYYLSVSFNVLATHKIFYDKMIISTVIALIAGW